MPFLLTWLTDIDREYLLTKLLHDGYFAPVMAFHYGWKLYDSVAEASTVVGNEGTRYVLYSHRYTLFDPSVYRTLIPGTEVLHDFSFGGPAIELDFPGKQAKVEKVALGRCCISYYAQYMNPVTGNKFKAPDNLIQIHREIQKEIKKRVVKRYCVVKTVKQGQLIFHPRAFWISAIALPDIMAGTSGLDLPADGWKSGSDFSITPQE
jgi:hypothetical protein